ncbi:hypothetical protein AKO1_012753 [Acrasis kona]|uniref:Transcriptional adapter n=1 Tax=Acrasis kona TaxID=1008807 RepID=A0AAW2YW02_9EUKA
MVSVKQESYSGGGSSAEDRLKGAQCDCDYCKKDISSQVHIKCAHCPKFNLCVDCFYVGVETTQHKNNHPYRVMDDMSAPLYTTKWGADEELLLLEGIETFGLGNWVDVAEHVGTKNKFECEYHYWSVYVDVDTFPLPQNNLTTLINDSKPITDRDVKKTDDGMLVTIKKNLGIKTSMSCTQNYEGPNKIKQPNPKIGLEVGFVPYRGDFDVEYDNDAEVLIGEMEISENDTPQERQYKLDILRLYDYKLAEREKRKKFAIERNIIDWKKTQTNEKKKNKEERDIVNKYRPFARFVSQEDFDDLMVHVIKEKQLRQRIEQLQAWRTRGISTIEGGELHEKKNNGTAAVNKHRSRSSVKKEDFVNLVSPSLENKNNNSNAFAQQENMFIGAELLSSKEREFCVELRMLPNQYILCKDALTRESFRQGFLSKSTAMSLLSDLEQNKVSKLYDYFVVCGWVTSPHQSG